MLGELEQLNFAIVVKKILAILLLLLLGIQSFHSFAIYSFFYANRNFIAQKLCVNNNKPQLNCNGKCFLNKQLKKAQQKESEDSGSIKLVEPLVYLAALPIAVKPEVESVAINHTPNAYVNAYSFCYLSSLLRPPCTVS